MSFVILFYDLKNNRFRYPKKKSKTLNLDYAYNLLETGSKQTPVINFYYGTFINMLKIFNFSETHNITNFKISEAKTAIERNY